MAVIDEHYEPMRKVETNELLVWRIATFLGIKSVNYVWCVKTVDHTLSR